MRTQKIFSRLLVPTMVALLLLPPLSCLIFRQAAKQYAYDEAVSAVPPVCGPRGSAKSPFGPVSNSDTHALSDVPLHVPVGCGDAYREADGWYTFRNIIEDPDIPVSGIIGVTAGSAADSDAPVYDLTGRKIAAPAEGQLYIKGGRKYVHRE